MSTPEKILEKAPCVIRSDSSYWISSAGLADLADISVQAAQKALLRASESVPWNGAELKVRKQGRAYLVDVRSLPTEMYQAWSAANRESLLAAPATSVERSVRPGRGDRPELLAKLYKEAEWKFGIIEPALQYPARSAGRGELLRNLAEQSYVRPTDGKPMRFAEAKLREYCRLYEEGGIHALMRKERAVETKPRVLVNRKWDSACPLPLPEKTRLAEEIGRYVRSLWANGAPSRFKVQQLASAKLSALCKEAGWEGATLKNCDVGRHLVEENQDFRRVAAYHRDAKRFDDNFRPRIARDRSEFKPGEHIVGDVHPVDILLAREGGDPYTPRMIAWYDLATNRFFYTLLHPAPGRSVTQADITHSFVDLCMTWGMPSTLYLDNGPEYIGAELVEGFKTLGGLGYELDVRLGAISALQAMWAAEGSGGEALEADPLDEPGDARGLRRARPYNAAAKPVEGAFSAKEKFLSMLPGYIGGDRMNKRVSKVGREPDKFPGSPEEFDKAFAEAVDCYHAMPQRGHLGGLSPNERYAATREGPVVTRADLPVFLMAFSEERELKVKTNGVELGKKDGGKWYWDDALVPLIGKKQTFRVAKWYPNAIVLVQGRAYTLIQERRMLGFFDPHGAKESSRLQGVGERHIRALKKDTDKLDLQDAMRTYVTEAGIASGTEDATPTPGPNDRRIGLSPEMAALGEQLRGDNPNPVERLQAGDIVDGNGKVHSLAASAKTGEGENRPALPVLPAIKYEKPAPRPKNPFDNFEEEYQQGKEQRKERSGGLGNRPTELIQPLTVARTIEER